MADKPASERTEQATPERLRKARGEGQIAQSREVPAAMMTLMLLIVLGLTASGLYTWFSGIIRNGLSFQLSGGSMNTGTFARVLSDSAGGALVTIMPFLLAAAAVSILSSLLVSGWAFAPKALRLDPSRISVVKGCKNLLSLRSLVNLAVSVGKLVLILMIVHYYLRNRMDECLALRWVSPGGIMVGIGKLVFGLMSRITIGLVGIAGIDLLYQRWHYKRQLRMTRQEVREERKQYEVSPEMKSRIRSVQYEMSRKRILQEVPTADVVITNPTHVAVALRYDSSEMGAPQVVAKGSGFLAAKVRELARQHGVPIVQRPDLARTLYSTVEPGQTIPQELFVAVAEVLAMIYRLGRKRRRTTAQRNQTR
jgi:flagellar biosynthetic protein FlhB